jgi:hypothetical protein
MHSVLTPSECDPQTMKNTPFLSGIGSIVPNWAMNTGVWSSLAVTLGECFGLHYRRRLMSMLGVIGPDDADFLAELERTWSEREMPNNIPRLGQLTQEEFCTGFAAQGMPVILAGVARMWPVMTWTTNILRERYGDLTLRVRKGLDYDKMSYTSMTLSQYLRAVEGGENFYMANNPIPAAMREAIVFPPYFDSSRYSYDATRVWIGGATSGTHLHRDLMDNFLLTVIGSKRVILGSPNQTEAVYSWEVHSDLASCKFSARAPDYTRFPKATKAKFVTIELLPGDLLYIPCGWYHEISNRNLACSVNYFLSSSCAQLPQWDNRRTT